MKFLYTLLIIIFFISCKENKNTQFDTNFCEAIHRNDSISLSKELEDISELMKTKTGVYVLEDGGGAMITRAWLTEYAEKTIDIQYFIFSLDNIGLIACDYLVRAADRGIKIRLLVDDFMVDAEIEDILILDSHENISIKIYNPGVNLGKNLFQKIGKFTTDFRSANQRMHNKTFIVDNKIVITGGRNIADEYFDYNHKYNFRDRDVLLLGKETAKINTSFLTFWNSELSVNLTDLVKISDFEDKLNNKNKFDKLHEYACNPENFWPQVRIKIKTLQDFFPKIKKSDKLVWLDDIEFISDIPGKNNETKKLSGGGKTTSKLIELVKKANETIDIQTPYLITSNLSLNLFKETINRGVKIRILTNSLSSTDNLEAFAAYQNKRKKILETGVEIYEFKPDAQVRMKVMTGELQKKLDFAPIFGLHSKTMVIDDEITIIGTFNLDPRSANLNTECIVIINSEIITKNVMKGINEEFKEENSWRTTLDFNPDSEVTKIKQLKTWTRRILPIDIL